MSLIKFAVALMLTLIGAAPCLAGNWPPVAADLSVTLSRANSGCLEGNDCRLAMQVENLGTAHFKGGLRIVIETAAPSVPGFVDSEEGTCERLAYGRMVCSAEAIDLAPAETMTGLVSLRFLPTIMSEVETCATIDWTGRPGSVARDAVASVLAALGKRDERDAADLLPAVFGTWGKGDLRHGNDRGCVSVAIAAPPADVTCPEGQGRIAGRCMALDDYCFGNRARDAKTKACGCPLATDTFDPLSRRCAAVVACDGGREAANGLCFCPAARPWWNARTGICEVWREPAPTAKPVVAMAPVEPEPAPPKKLIAPPIEKVETPPAPRPKKIEAPPIRKVVAAEPRCGRDEIRRAGTCVKRVAEVVKQPRPKPRRVARRGLASSAAVWRREASRCPPIFAYCWVKVIRAYSKHKRLVRGG